MKLPLRLRPEAEAEMGEAALWYSSRSPGLGGEFLDEVEEVLELIRSTPARYPVAEGEVRKTVLSRFPYLLLYVAREREIIVLSCFHARRDPNRWRERVE